MGYAVLMLYVRMDVNVSMKSASPGDVHRLERLEQEEYVRSEGPSVRMDTLVLVVDV